MEHSTSKNYNEIAKKEHDLTYGVKKVSNFVSDGEGNIVRERQPYLTRFNELLTATRFSQFNFKPTWGVSSIRYDTTTTGTGAQVDEENGEFKLESGTSANGITIVRTNRRGQYQAGTMGQAGIGIRIPTAPTGTQFIEWGYTDFTNGFYFGYDATGVYVAYETGGTVTKAYQTDWNVDKLDGSGHSGLTLDLSNGNVSQIDFTWYGYGDIEFSFHIADQTTKKIRRVECHRFKIDGSASIVDPNQPLSFRVGNGATSTSNLVVYIGGHQFSVVNGESTGQTRGLSELLTNFSTALNTNWQPLIAIREKTTFRGRPNSVNVRLKDFIVATDGDLEVRLTINGTTSNLSWTSPTGVSANETSVETKITTTGTALTTSSDGTPIEYAFVNSSGAGVNESGSSIQDVDIVLGSGSEAILWVRRLSGTGVITAKHAHLSWIEEW